MARIREVEGYLATAREEIAFISPAKPERCGNYPPPKDVGNSWGCPVQHCKSKNWPKDGQGDKDYKQHYRSDILSEVILMCAGNG